MMSNSSELIKNALEVLQLPNLITKDDIKKQYRYLSKKKTP
jgi:curved DNA-binding protein CbpA